MSRDNLVIIHFQPLELYPPIQNLLIILNEYPHSKKIKTITTNQNGFSDFYIGQTEKNEIIRKDVHSENRFFRFLKFFNFYVFTYFKLIKEKPKQIIYFESLSALPVLLYKISHSKTKVFAHYHEYTSPSEYKSNMIIQRMNHWLEKRAFNKFEWISHTNEKRLELFSVDHPKIKKSILKKLPNYPSKKWIETLIDYRIEEIKEINFIYVGPLSFEDTYIREVCEFISLRKEYTLKLYSQRITTDFKNYFSERKFTNIMLLGAIDYFNIPKKLVVNQIGLILYKCNTLNQRYCAPNKLFEYLSCGLDVWYPNQMIGCEEFKSNLNPKVIEIDFLNIEKSIANYSFDFQEKKIPNLQFSAEDATNELLKELLKD